VGKHRGRYPVGHQVHGKVTKLVAYGAFVEVEEGVEGLIHVSELSWTKRIARPSDVLTVGQEVNAVVLGINKEERKISLGVRQLDTNPWDDIDARYPIGTQMKRAVRNLTAYGAFVELEEGIDGMIHVSDLSWTRKINHPSELLKKGQEVDAVVLGIDKANQRISLGMKQLDTDPWSIIDTRFKVGDVVKGRVAKIASFGAFVELEDDIDGLVHISQISEDRIEKVKDKLNVGDEVEARVIKVDKVERRIGLSIKADAGPDGTCRALITPARLSDTADAAALTGDGGEIRVIRSADATVTASGTTRAQMLDVVDDFAMFLCVSDQVESAMTVLIGFSDREGAPVRVCRGVLLQALPGCDLAVFHRLREALGQPRVRELLAAAEEEGAFAPENPRGRSRPGRRRPHGPAFPYLRPGPFNAIAAGRKWAPCWAPFPRRNAPTSSIRGALSPSAAISAIVHTRSGRRNARVSGRNWRVAVADEHGPIPPPGP
jgi:predicted RNA-binding protein with RPS1 domain